MTPPPASWPRGPFPSPSSMPPPAGAGFSYLLHMALSPALLLVHALAHLVKLPPRSLRLASPLSITASCPGRPSGSPKASAPSLVPLPHCFSFSISTLRRASWQRPWLAPHFWKLHSVSAWVARCSISSCEWASFPKACASNAATFRHVSHAKFPPRKSSAQHRHQFNGAHYYC